MSSTGRMDFVRVLIFLTFLFQASRARLVLCLSASAGFSVLEFSELKIVWFALSAIDDCELWECEGLFADQMVIPLKWRCIDCQFFVCARETFESTLIRSLLKSRSIRATHY